MTTQNNDPSQIRRTIPAPPRAESTQPHPGARRWRSLVKRLTSISCAGYILLVMGIWLFTWLLGDRTARINIWPGSPHTIGIGWLATMCLFGPRWIEFFPLAVLLPLAIAFSRKWIAALLGIALLIAVPIMDLRITRGGLFPPDRPSGSLRVLTLNTHFGYTDPVKFKALLAETQPDVIALQEWYPGNRDAIFGGASWNLIQSSEAITASRYPIAFDKMTTGMANISGGVTYHYTITLPNRNLSFFSVHLASPHSAFRGVLHRSRSGNRQLEANSRERLREARILNKYADDDTLLAGDFNLPRDSTIFRSCFARLSDAFTDAGLGYGLTYYSQWTTVRIDHILMGKNWRCTHCWVGPDVGSPHRPVIADLIYMQDRR